MLQRPQKTNTSIDKLAKNLITAKLMNNGLGEDSMTKGASQGAAGRSTHSRRKPNKLMSSMNEDFQDPTASLMKATDVTDSSLLSGLVGKQSPPSPQSAAAALQALLDRTGQANGLGGHSGLYQAAFNSSPAKNANPNGGGGGLGSLLTSKELAKLNLDVRNFKLQDSANSPQMQLQYNLNSLLGGSNGTNLNQLLLQQAGIDSNLLSGLMNSLNTNEKLNLLAKGRQSNQSTPNKSSRPSMTNGGRLEDHDDETVSAAAMLAAAGHGLNIGMINKHNQQQQRQARRNGDLIKGNSMSPSPRGSCSEETETLHSSSGSPLSSTHDAVVNGVSGHHSSSSSSASASGSDTGRQRRRQKDSTSGANGSKYNMANDEEGDLDDVDEDSRSSPNGSHSPHSSSLTQNGDHDLTANQNGDCDNSMMDNADDDDRHHDENDDLDDGDLDEDDLDEDQYDTTTNSSMNNSQALASGRQRNHRKSLKGNDSASALGGRNRNNSASSPTRSSSSQAQSRSVSPSLYHRDSPSSSSAAAAAAFPNLAAVAAANGIDSATAMLAAQSLLQQQTPGLTFPSLAASGLALPTVGGAASTSSSKDQATTRKRRNDREAMSERIKKIKPVPADKKDDAYWERRRKNNEAAKRSRDLRRQKEDEIAVRASFLEQENLKLKAQVTILKAELSKLHFMLYNR